MNNITHKNHYVPQFYLKNWSEDGNKIWVYSIIVPDSKVPYWRKFSISSTAIWNDLYTQYNGIEEIDYFENWFNKEFETPTEPVTTKIIQGNKLNSDEYRILSRFIFAQSIRVPKKMTEILEISKTTVSEMLDSLNFSKIRKEDIIKSNNDNLEEIKKLPVSIEIDRDNGQLKFETKIGRAYYLYALKHLLTERIEIAENYKWHIIHSHESISFPTSDNPVILLNFNSKTDYNFNGAWKKKNSVIVFPISPKILLFAQIGSNNSFSFLDYDLEWSEFFRKIIIENSFRFVYANTVQKGMLSIKPRIIDLDLFIKQKNIVGDWGEEQQKIEREYLQ